MKCSVMPSGNTSFHIWKEGAKTGEPCECGRHLLNVVGGQETGEHGKYDGTTIREVLQWASDNTVMVAKSPEGKWFCLCKMPNQIAHPTLYDCIYQAWINRGL